MIRQERSYSASAHYKGETRTKNNIGLILRGANKADEETHIQRGPTCIFKDCGLYDQVLCFLGRTCTIPAFKLAACNGSTTPPFSAEDF